MVSWVRVEGKMHVASLSLLITSSPQRLAYIHGQSKEVRACGSTISNLKSLDILPKRGFILGWSIVDTMRRILFQVSNIQRFLSSKIGFTLFQATQAHGLSNNQVIKWYHRLELRGRCMLLRFLSSSSHLHNV